MEVFQVYQDIQNLQQNSNSHSKYLEILWLELNQQEEMLKLIQQQNSNPKQNKINKLKKIITFVIPYLDLKEIYRLRLISTEFQKVISKQKKVISEMIDKQIEQKQEKLYEFNIFDRNSRELYMHIIKLNCFAQQLEVATFPQNCQSLLQQICDPSQIYSQKAISKFYDNSKKLVLQNGPQKQIMDSYLNTTYYPQCSNETNFQKEYQKYRKEILRQKNLKKLHKLKSINNNL